MKINKALKCQAKFLLALYSNVFYRWLNSPVNFLLENTPFLNSVSPSKGYYVACDNYFLVALTLKFWVGNYPAFVTSAVIRPLSSQVPALLHLKLWNWSGPGAGEKLVLISVLTGSLRKKVQRLRTWSLKAEGLGQMSTFLLNHWTY